MTGKRYALYIVIAVLTIGLAVFLYYFGEKVMKILSPFFIAVLISYLIYPLVARLERRGVKRNIAIIIVYILITFTLVFFGIFIMPEVFSNARELFSTIPEITGKYQGLFDSVISKIKTSKWPPEIKNFIFREIDNFSLLAQGYTAQLMKKSISAIASSLMIIFNTVISMIIAYYFIKDTEGLKRGTLMFVPKKMRNGLISIGRELNSIVTHFIQGQLMTALIVGLLETIGLYIVRIKYPFILGLIGGIANIIPYFGPVLGAIPAVAIALLQSPVKALMTALVFIVVQQIDNAFISPKIIEGKLGLHPVSTIIAVLIGGEFFGIIGMLIGVPVAAMLKVILKRGVDYLV